MKKIHEILKYLIKNRKKDIEDESDNLNFEYDERNRKYFKYNTDDILEILVETLAERNGFKTFSTHSDLFYECDGDEEKFWFVGVIGDLGDPGVTLTNLVELYKNMQHNGSHTDSIWSAPHDETP